MVLKQAQTAQKQFQVRIPLISCYEIFPLEANNSDTK